MVLLLVQVINNPRRRFRQLPPELGARQQPQHTKTVRIEEKRSVGGSGEVGVEMGEVGEEFLVFKVALFDEN